MESQRKNKFKKINHHLKSKQIDEKLELLSEIPTNNISNYFVIEPDYYVQDPDIEGLPRSVDFAQDALANGRDTTGLFLEDGTILTIEPPGDTSYILGPMASMWYAWGNFSTIGYIRQSDRRMVDLARITGQLENWNGSSNFTSYGQLTLEQADWFRTTPKYENYRAFYPGPPSNVPDQYGRYYCVITGTPKSERRTPPRRRVPPVLGGPDPNLPPGSAKPKKQKEEDLSGLSDRELYDLGLYRGSDGKLYRLPTNRGKTGYDSLDPLNVAFDYILGRLGLGAALAFRNWANQGKNQRIPNEDAADWARLWADDWAQRGKPGDGTKGGWDPTRGFRPGVPADKGGIGSGPTPAGRQAVTRAVKPGMGASGESKNKQKTQKNSYDPEGQVLSESRQKILRDLKKPVVLPEEKNEKIKHRPRVIGAPPKTINSNLMKKAEVPSSYIKPEERLWGKYEKNQNARLSQERKNEVLDHLGGSNHAWEWLTETSRQKNQDIMYGHFGGDKKKVIRKEEIKGDTLLFIVDENGKKENILQSELSIKLADEFNKELFEKYFQEQETLQADKDPLFRRVSKKLKTEIDYPDKPSKAGYPDVPPPEMINGWHPEYGQDKMYYNKLDPHSAESMPPTGDPQIDAKVSKAKRIKKIVKGT